MKTTVDLYFRYFPVINRLNYFIASVIECFEICYGKCLSSNRRTEVFRCAEPNSSSVIRLLM